MPANIKVIGKRWAIFAVVTSLCHHAGPAFGPLGDVFRGTRYADYIDIITPFAVVGLGAWLLLAVPGVSTRRWGAFAFASIVYVEGHGMHLSANSIDNQHPIGAVLTTTHYWDEVAGHIFWFGGFGLIAGVLITAGFSAPAITVPRACAALVYGFAATTTAIEGGVVPLAFVIALIILGLSLRRKTGLAQDALIAYGFNVALLIVWGVWHGGFPQFSELGWI